MLSKNLALHVTETGYASALTRVNLLFRRFSQFDKVFKVEKNNSAFILFAVMK